MPVQPPGPYLSADFLQGLRADRGQERGELHPVLAPCLPWPEREPQERERRVLCRTSPVAVLAVHDRGLTWMEFQADPGHPLMQRGQDLAGLVLADAVD